MMFKIMYWYPRKSKMRVIQVLILVGLSLLIGLSGCSASQPIPASSQTQQATQQATQQVKQQVSSGHKSDIAKMLVGKPLLPLGEIEKTHTAKHGSQECMSMVSQEVLIIPRSFLTIPKMRKGNRFT